MITPTTAPARARTARSDGERSARLATASAITSIVRVNSSIARALISGTPSVSWVVSRICVISSSLNEVSASSAAARIAGIGARPGGCRENASSIRVSRSSRSTTSSLVGK
jgi:hypothetical protein